MASNRLQKFLRWTVWGASLLLGLLLALHLLLPYVVNTRSIRTRILSLAAQSVRGDIDFQHLQPSLLPRPHAVLTRVHLSVPRKLNLQIAEVGIYPKFRSLLTGRVQIDRLRVMNPRIEIDLPAPDSAAEDETKHQPGPAIKKRVAAALAIMVPSLAGTDVALEGGRLALLRGARPFIDLHAISLLASVGDEWLNVELRGRSEPVEMVALQGKFNLATLDASGQLTVKNLDTGRIRSLEPFSQWGNLPEMAADMAVVLETRRLEEAEARFTAKAPTVVLKRRGQRSTLGQFAVQGRVRWTAQQLDASISQLQTIEPAIQLNGSLHWQRLTPSSDGTVRLTIMGTDLDLGTLRGEVLRLGGDIKGLGKVFNIVRGARIPDIAISLSAAGWRQLAAIDDIRAEARVADGRLVIPDDRLHLEAVSGKFAFSKGRLLGENIAARLGRSQAGNGVLQWDLLKGSESFRLETDLDADLNELPAVLKKLTGSRSLRAQLDRLPALNGRAAGRFALGDRLDRLSANLNMDADIQLLDAAVNVSGPIDGLPTPQTRAQLSVSGHIGPQAVEWLRGLGELPSDLLPPGPLSIARADLLREKNGRLGIEGEFTLGKDLKMSAALAIKPEAIHLDALHLKDARSEAFIALKHALAGNRWDGRFKGRLHKTTLDKLWRGNDLLEGWIQGDLQARVDVAMPGRSILQGQLEAQGVHLPLPAGPIDILNARLTFGGHGFTIPSAALAWQAQAIQLSGGGEFHGQRLNLDLKLTAPKLDADKLITVFRNHNPPLQSAPAPNHSVPQVRGNLAVKADQMHLGGYRFSDVQTAVSRQNDQTMVTVANADLCGISATGTIHVSKSGIKIDLKPHAAQSPLKDTSACLARAKITERLEGTVDLGGRLSSQGNTPHELIRNLNGRLKIRIADGKIYNIGTAGFFTNLLSYLSVNQLVKGGMPDLRKSDFFYHRIESQFELKDGVLHVEEGILKSNAVNIVGEGRYALIDNKVALTLLVSPLTTVDWIVERLPIVGRILKGTLVAIPVSVKGPAPDPAVIPLSPSAVGSRVGGILKRTIEAPYRIIKPILPGEASIDGNGADTSKSDTGKDQ